MDYIIRKANTNDTKRLNELLTKLIRDEKKYDDNINENYVVKSYYEYVIPKKQNIILVAELSNTVIGYLYGYIINDGDTTTNKVAKIDALFIEEEYRNFGIGSSLINEFKKIVKDKVKYIEVNVCSDNKNALTTYKNNGFNEIKSITMRLDLY